MWMGRVPEQDHFPWIARQQVETRLQAVHPVNEQGEVNGRLPWKSVPRHGAPAETALHSWHDAHQHGEEAAGRNRGCAIERERASSLADHLCSACLTGVRAGHMVTRVRVGPLLTQFDDLVLRVRLPRRDYHLINRVPLHRL